MTNIVKLVVIGSQAYNKLGEIVKIKRNPTLKDGDSFYVMEKIKNLRPLAGDNVIYKGIEYFLESDASSNGWAKINNGTDKKIRLKHLTVVNQRTKLYYELPDEDDAILIASSVINEFVKNSNIFSRLFRSYSILKKVDVILLHPLNRDVNKR